MKSDTQHNAVDVSEKRSINQDRFNRIVGYLASKYGLRIPLEKKVMFESRLYKRLSLVGVSTFEAYFDYVFSRRGGEEYRYFIDLVTTHKTFFFREDYQFEYLRKLVHKQYYGTNRKFNIWSAGCSTGEEVYTLGIVMNELKKDLASLDYKIVGTDISIPSLNKAAEGVFNASELSALPEGVLDNYFTVEEKSGNKQLHFTNAEIKSRINLGILNLNNQVYHLPHQFDFIFCRNVIIYFDADTQKKVLGRLVEKIKPGGYLFLGHSETAIGSTLPIRSIRPTIYQKLP